LWFKKIQSFADGQNCPLMQDKGNSFNNYAVKYRLLKLGEQGPFILRRLCGLFCTGIFVLWMMLLNSFFAWSIRWAQPAALIDPRPFIALFATMLSSVNSMSSGRITGVPVLQAPAPAPVPGI
jgi:hypothetical protein